MSGTKHKRNHGGWTPEARKRARDAQRCLRFATNARDDDAICLVRLQLLKGRNMALVEDLHRVALLQLPPEAVNGWQVIDPRMVPRLLASLQAQVLPDQEPSPSRMRSCWGRLAELAERTSSRKGGCA